MDVRELRKITEEFAKELAQYIIDRFMDYGLDFNFEEPRIASSHEVVTLNLWGLVLPDDVSVYDEQVLSKFLTKTFDDFIESHIEDGYKEWAANLKKTRFHCYIFTPDEASRPFNCEIELFYD